MKQKFLQILALLALVVVPWTGQAQSGCTIRVAGEDSYGDGWNGGSLDIIQGTDTLANFALTGGSGELNVVLTGKKTTVEPKGVKCDTDCTIQGGSFYSCAPDGRAIDVDGPLTVADGYTSRNDSDRRLFEVIY